MQNSYLLCGNIAQQSGVANDRLQYNRCAERVEMVGGRMERVREEEVKDSVEERRKKRKEKTDASSGQWKERRGRKEEEETGV